MFMLLVQVEVKPEHVEAFKAITAGNARNSVQEPGIARFDFFQQQDDPTRFVLVEIYRTPESQAQHRETAHYRKWRDTVEGMMAKPRVGLKYDILFPGEEGW